MTNLKPFFGERSVEARELIAAAKITPYEEVKKNLDAIARKTRKALSVARARARNGRREA